MKDFSVVIPLYKSEKLIEPFFRVLKDSFASSRKSFEIIYVDDCSPDNSYHLVQELKRQHSNIRLLQTHKNTGQYKATICGILRSEGDYIMTLDSDCSLAASSLSQWISSLSLSDELWYAEFTDKNRNIFRSAGAKIFDSIVKVAAGGDKGISKHSGSSSRIIKGEFARAVLKNLYYPVLLDVTLIGQTKSEIKFYEVTSYPSDALDFSSYGVFDLFKMGFYLLFSLIADKVYTRARSSEDHFTEQ